MKYIPSSTPEKVVVVVLGFPCGSAGKDLPAMRETWVQSLGWEDSPGEGKDYPLQYSGLEKSMNCMYSPCGHKESDTTK